ncbi:MAG: ATP-binding response regulator [Anaerolineae bacterium]
MADYLNQESLPPEFVAQVTEALRHLYEPSALVRSPLAARLLPPDPSADRRARLLRALLLETVESLNPGPRVPFRSLSARSYQALHLHYVQGHTVEDVGRLLALSLRQAYRDIRKGESDLATLLWQRRQPEPQARQPGLESSPNRTVQQEVERLPLHPADVSLLRAIEQAAEPLAVLAARAGVDLSVRLPGDYSVRVDLDALRQCLTAFLSCAVQACEPGRGQIAVTAAAGTGRDTTVTVDLVSRPLRAGGLEGLVHLVTLAHTLADALGGVVDDDTAGRSEAHWRLRLPLSRPNSVMVIDDNEGMPALFRRYLSDSGYTVVGVQNAHEGLLLAQERPPSAIVLDIIMPGTDGWAVLAQLKANPVTADVPVIVCSVFNDPGLAGSLGAAACLCKPVSQATLLRVLDEVGRGGGAAASGASPAGEAPPR